MSQVTTIATWIGYAVLTAGALGMAVAVVAGLYGVLALSFSYWVRRVYRGVVNWRAVSSWVANGKPEFKRGPDNVARMTPTDGRDASMGES